MKCTAVVVMLWCCTETALLILVADLCSVPIFLALEALCEVAVSIVELTVFELTLKEQFLINECVDLN